VGPLRSDHTDVVAPAHLIADAEVREDRLEARAQPARVVDGHDTAIDNHADEGNGAVAWRCDRCTYRGRDVDPAMAGSPTDCRW